jgi:protocatechuate 3,4-dioxygenase beta subunit
LGLAAAKKNTASESAVERKAGAPPKPGNVRGEIKYPWGTVAQATVIVGTRSVLSDYEGRFEVVGMKPGDYSIDVRAPFPGYEAPPTKVTVVSGETAVVDVYLDFERAIVHGHVYDQDGKPVAGASLSGVIGGKEAVTTSTDDKGYFKFENASPGAQYIRVSAPGYMAKTLDFTASKSEETKLDFNLTKAAHKLHGTVSDENGRPLRAEMVLSSSARIILQKGFSDGETGYYEFPVLPGTYGLLATVPEYQSEGWRGDITSDTKVDLNLKPAPEPPPPSRD